MNLVALFSEKKETVMLAIKSAGLNEIKYSGFYRDGKIQVFTGSQQHIMLLIGELASMGHDGLLEVKTSN